MHCQSFKKAKQPTVNAIVAEIRLAVAPWGLELEAVHWWSSENVLADKLPRLKDSEGPANCLLNTAIEMLVPVAGGQLLGHLGCIDLSNYMCAQENSSRTVLTHVLIPVHLNTEHEPQAHLEHVIVEKPQMEHVVEHSHGT